MAPDGFDSPEKRRQQKSDESDTDFSDNGNANLETSQSESEIGSDDEAIKSANRK